MPIGARLCGVALVLFVGVAAGASATPRGQPRAGDLPQGQLVLVHHDGTRSPALRLVVLRSGAAPVTLSGEAVDVYPPAAFSSDGASVLAVLDPQVGSFWLTEFSVADGTQRRVAELGLGDRDPTYLPDGRIGFVLRRGGRECVTVVRPDGSAPSHLVCRTLVAWPRWRPDGRRMVFVRSPRAQRPGADAIYADELVVATGTGGRPRLLTKTPAESPAWSPDGSAVAFGTSRYTGPKQQTVRIVSASGANERVFAEGTEPAWSPDGKWIAYVCNRASVCVKRLDGSGERRVWTSPARQVVWLGAWGSAP